MKEAFTNMALSKESLALIVHMRRIVDTYLDQGLTLTLRQLYYRLVASDLVPNTERSYKRVGRILSDARMCGLIDWNAIEDRERGVITIATWDGPEDILRAARDGLMYDHWAEQPNAIEVWVEKKALAEVVSRACGPLRASWMACKGYMSQTEMYYAAKRAMARWERGQPTIIIHLGDHDPSGIDMSRDIEARFRVFGAHEHAVEVRRIALTRQQVDEYNPPPNPAKTTDSRFKEYQRLHGSESWELDAIEPQELIRLIRDEIDRHVDHDVFERVCERERIDRQRMDRVVERWETL